MQPLIDRLLANDLADLEGLEIKASLPISETLANELATAYMDEFFVDTPSPKESDPTTADYIKVIKRLKPDLFKISFESGKAVVDFELKR